MFRMKTHVCAAMIVIAMVAGWAVPGLADGGIVFGSLTASPPLAFEDEGDVKGFLPEVFRNVSARAGLDIRLKGYPTRRLEEYLRTGAVDGAVFITRLERRDPFLLYASVPIIVSRILVFVKKGQGFEFTGIPDLFGRKVGVVLGWNTLTLPLKEAAEKGKVEVDTAPGQEQNLKKLMARRVDCIIGTEQISAYYINKLGLGGQVEALSPAASEIRAYIAFSRKSKNIHTPEAAMERMDAALDGMLSDGTYDRLMQQYGLTLSN